MIKDLEGWRRRHKKPVLVSEYGAETVAGLHWEPSLMFSEEYQTDFMEKYFKVFDVYRKEFLIGEVRFLSKSLLNEEACLELC
jgi:beta-glucuronidase